MFSSNNFHSLLHNETSPSGPRSLQNMKKALAYSFLQLIVALCILQHSIIKVIIYINLKNTGLTE